MGQSVGLLLGVTGAIAGSFVGQPELGFLAGNLLGSILFPKKGPSPPDVRVQDSAYGKWIPRAYGRYRMAGNIIWLGTPHSHDTSGKGMGGKLGGPYTTLSFAVGLCDGPIQGINRIWANGKLIYDVSNPADFQALSGSSTMVTGFTVYPGDENQLADPTMESQLGAGNVPAYRGLAYVVFNELNLQQWGNYLPSFTFEVITSGAQTSQAFTETSYTLPTGGSWYFTMIPHLTAQGGQALMTNGSPAAGVTVANLSAYGSSVQTVLYKTNTGGTVPGGWSLAGTVAGNSDVPGAYFGNMWLYPDGTYDALPDTPEVGFDAIEVIFGRTGDDLFLMSYWGGSSLLYRCSIVNGGAVSAQTTVQINSFYGASADYVYAGYYGTLYQLNRETMAVVQSWASVPGAANSSIGYVVDDNNVYLCDGNRLYLFDPATGSSSLLGTFTFSPTSLAVISPSLIVAAAATGGSGGGSVTFGYLALTTTGNQVTLGGIVSDLLDRAGLSPTQYDVSQLTDTVIGFSVTGNSSTRDNLTPLMESYFFDVGDSDGLLKCVKRGGAAAVSIPWDDLGAAQSDTDTAAQNPIVQVIKQEWELPRSETVTYVSASTDYQPGTQREQRAATTSNLDESVNVPIVMADNEAKVRVQSMLWERWTKRPSFSWSTSRKYLALEPADVVVLNGQNGEQYPVRITDVTNDGKGGLSFKGDPSVAAIYPNFTQYTAQGGVASGFAPQAIGYSGPTALAVMDLPPLRNQDTTPGLYLAACGYAASWPGVIIDVSRDDVNFSEVTQVNNRSAIGVTTSVLPNWQGGNKLDVCSTVTVQLVDESLSLSSVSYASLINGANPALIGNELVYFMTATQTAPGTYQLSGFLRGRIGTEAAISTHAVGERFVLLSASAIAQYGISVTDIGSPLYFDAYLTNLYGGTPGGSANVTPANARVQPLAPHLLVASRGSASSLLDITVQWFRRARVNFGWLDGTDVPLDESSEAYTLTVLNGSTVVRTVTVSGPFTGTTQPNWLYTAADISGDGFTPGETITFQVQMNSNQGVTGQAATTTITR